MEIKKRKQLSAKTLGAQKVEGAKAADFGPTIKAKSGNFGGMESAKTIQLPSISAKEASYPPGLTIKKKNSPSMESKPKSLPSIRSIGPKSNPSMETRPVEMPNIKTKRPKAQDAEKSRPVEMPSIKARTGGVQKRKVEGAPIDVVAESPTRDLYLKRMKKRAK